MIDPHPRPGSLPLPGPSRAVLTATSTPRFTGITVASPVGLAPD